MWGLLFFYLFKEAYYQQKNCVNLDSFLQNYKHNLGYAKNTAMNLRRERKLCFQFSAYYRMNC